MKRTFLVFAILFAAAAPAASQSQVRERRSGDVITNPAPQQPVLRSRVIGDTNKANHSSAKTSTTASVTQPDEPKPAWGNTSVLIMKSQPVVPPRATPIQPSQSKTSAQPKLVKPTTLAVENNSTAANLRAPAPVNTIASTAYRVGPGDVLDIKLVNVATKESTLFTVMKDGVVEYPLLPRPMMVNGLTTEEISRRLRGEITVIKDPRLVVSVRDFASHAVMVTGLVDNPGRKILRREVMPLFAILAESLPRSDATVATIVRNGRETNLTISDTQDMATPVMAGDTIKVSAAPKRFVYLGGDVASTGEREFRDGMTLTQALLAAGGPRDAKSKVKVARRNQNGFLASEEYSLAAISDGKAPDPLLQAGDRIEVQRGVW
ncbi:MAG TPA: polysaccharide biosynthesis/export family protein [Pyrinomonadaceae bacterium]|nr:polysaccharide biosynthesis/export family protein [Pyrinomonadaceae bacterium]